MKKNREDITFEQWKKANLLEGFLDGEEEKPASTEDVAAEEETKETTSDDAAPIEEPAAEEGNSDTSAPVEGDSENTDISDEAQETEQDDGLDDDFEGEQKEDTGIENGGDPEVAELKDAIATLTQQIQALTDQMIKSNGGESAEGGETSGEEGSESAEEPTEETPEEAPAEEASEETSEEFSEKPADESGEEKSEEGSEENSEESAPVDNTKSEAYNYYHKRGKILSENSGYMISILDEGRFDKLEDSIMAVVKAKIRQRIENEKTRIKTEAFNKKFGQK